MDDRNGRYTLHSFEAIKFKCIEQKLRRVNNVENGIKLVEMYYGSGLQVLQGKRAATENLL